MGKLTKDQLLAHIETAKHQLRFYGIGTLGGYFCHCVPVWHYSIIKVPEIAVLTTADQVLDHYEENNLFHKVGIGNPKA